MELTMLNIKTTIPAIKLGQDPTTPTYLTHKLQKLALAYEPCFLEDLGETSLMNRTDTKFVLPLKLGIRALSEMQAHYQVLSIDSQRLQPYNTLYFDTPDYYFYHQHQRSRATRFKLRVRTYLANDLKYLEIKQRTSKGRTVKERVQLDNLWPMLDGEAISWAVQRLPGAAWPLEPVLNNSFYRLLLVNPEQAERITLDFELQFSNSALNLDLGPVVVAEVKRKSSRQESVFINWLHGVHQRPSSFSKYCVGLALLHPDLKRNQFKPKLLQLQKMRYA